MMSCKTRVMLSLPEEFVLLLHKDNGSYYATADYTGAAELGELVVQHRVEFAGKKVKLVDPSLSGVSWIDEAVAFLAEKNAATKPVAATHYIQHRRSARKVHAAALAGRGLMRHERTKALGFIPSEKYFPDTTARNEVLGALHAVARGERELGNRLAVLAALVNATNLAWSLGFDRAERKRLKEIGNGERFGAEVDASVAAANAALMAGAVIAVTTAAGSS